MVRKSFYSNFDFIFNFPQIEFQQRNFRSSASESDEKVLKTKFILLNGWSIGYLID